MIHVQRMCDDCLHCRTCTSCMCDVQDVSYNAHVRRTCMGVASLLLCPRPVFVIVMADKLSMLAAVAITIIRRRCWRRVARMGREWSRDWLKERQSENEFIIAQLTAAPGGFHSFLRVTNDQFTELLTYVELIIIGCDTKMRECIKQTCIMFSYLLTARQVTSLTAWCIFMSIYVRRTCAMNVYTMIHIRRTPAHMYAAHVS